MSETDVLILLSVLLIVVAIAVVAVALIAIRISLAKTSEGLATLGSALEGVEAEHLRPIEPAVTAINAQFVTILGALPGIARKAAIVAERRPR
jgi:heme/copper-type cytochrome/quinol oxidase subunit 2